ncbi:MAG: gliding motility protein GldN [Chitinophagales bacterium]
MQVKKISLLLLILSVFTVSLSNAQTKKKSTKKKKTTTTQTDPSTSGDGSSVSADAVSQEAAALPPATDPAAVTTGITTAPASTDPNALAPAAATASTVDPNAVKTEVPKLPWVQEITGKRMAMGYEPIREADVFWWKTVWRVIDLREKINLHFKWPKAPFIQIMLDAINGGKTQVYSGMDDDFSTPIDPKEALSVAGGGVDSIYVMDPVTQIQTLQVINKEVNWNNVNKLRLKETWFFNKQTSTMEVRIMGICPLYDNYDPTTGDFRGEVPIFWIYFPSMRQILVNSQAYNPFPNGVRLNWDQVFALRLFGSYIYKVDNVQDFRIKDYKSGIDILYESEAKKNELFTFEHDLWEY